MAVPSFLLKKLYVKGSLKNTGSGFEFALKNNLAPGSLIGLGPLTLDGNSIPLEAVTFKSPQGQVQANQVSSQSPRTFGLNMEVKVTVEGEPLTPGSHTVVLGVLTREVGRIDIEATDTLE
jgi:hydroxymethylglutaryl-CoA reductase (NADPH)